MLTACLQAVVHRFVQAGLVTLGAGIDARLHLGIGSMSHGGLLHVGQEVDSSGPFFIFRVSAKQHYDKLPFQEVLCGGVHVFF